MAKSTYQQVRWPYKIRLKIIGPFGQHLPAAASALVSYYKTVMVNPPIQFSVDGLPRSLNHMYNRSVKNGKVHTWKKSDIDDFDDRVYMELGRLKWKPKGVCAALIFLETPQWITKEHQVRQMDADNRVKVVMDAIEKATSMPDELCWQHHVFKIASKRKRTTVCLFDLGDVVEYYY